MQKTTMDPHVEYAADAVRAAPPVVVSISAMVVESLNVVVVFLTIIYLVIQITHRVWKWKQEAKQKEFNTNNDINNNGVL